MSELITFAESEGEKPFDWDKFLDRALKGEISDKEDHEACILSGSWVTCSVGNQCEIIARDHLGIPRDEDLESYGRIFYGLICEKDYYHARIYLRKIEKRSAKLIREILEKEADNA